MTACSESQSAFDRCAPFGGSAFEPRAASGDRSNRLVFLRPDVADAVRAYLVALGSIATDELGEALIVGSRRPSRENPCLNTGEVLVEAV